MKKNVLIKKLSGFFLSDKWLLPMGVKGQRRIIDAAMAYKALFNDTTKTQKELDQAWITVGKTSFSPGPEMQSNPDEKERLQALMITFAVIEGSDLNRAKRNADKLWNLFGNYKRCQTYLTRYAADPNERLSIHNSCLFKLPDSAEKWFKEAWANLVLEQHSVINYLAIAPEIEALIKGRLTLEAIKKAAQEISYPRAVEHPELAQLCLRFNKSNSVFEKCLAILNNKKTSDRLPDITFEGKIFGKEYEGYTFSKLPPGDIRGFFLGNFTHCCQSIDREYASSVRDGMTRKHSGFYIITDKKGEIVAQNWAWVGTHGELVFDSYERKDFRYDSLCKTFYDEASRQAKCQGFNFSYLGKEGNTPEKLTFIEPETFDETEMLPEHPIPDISTDADEQYLLAIPTGSDDFETLAQDFNDDDLKIPYPSSHQDPAFLEIYRSPDAWKDYFHDKPKKLQVALITRHDKEGHNLFDWAFTHNNVEFLKYMSEIMPREKLQVLALQNDAQGTPLLEITITNHCFGAIDFLVKEGIIIPTLQFWKILQNTDFAIDKSEPISQYYEIFNAIEKDDEASFNRIIDKLPILTATNAEGESLLEVAVSHNRTSCIKKILSLDIPFYELIHSKEIILNSALRNINQDILKALKKYGAINYTELLNSDKFTYADGPEVIHAIVEAGISLHTLLIKLIKKMIQPETTTHRQFWEPDYVSLNILKAFIDSGADVNQPDTNGILPLHYALSLYNKDIDSHQTAWRAVKLLLLCGADPYLKDSSGNTPLELIQYAIVKDPMHEGEHFELLYLLMYYPFIRNYYKTPAEQALAILDISSSTLSRKPQSPGFFPDPETLDKQHLLNLKNYLENANALTQEQVFNKVEEIYEQLDPSGRSHEILQFKCEFLEEHVFDQPVPPFTHHPVTLRSLEDNLAITHEINAHIDTGMTEESIRKSQEQRDYPHAAKSSTPHIYAETSPSSSEAPSTSSSIKPN